MKLSNTSSPHESLRINVKFHQRAVVQNQTLEECDFKIGLRVNVRILYSYMIAYQVHEPK